jgi:hypothetical protein
MTNTRISETLTRFVTRAIKSTRLLTLAMVTTFTSLAIQPAAQAQSSDTWKSLAIIGGSTIAGAYVGHKVGGSGGAWVGAAVGASTGYAIDRRRRANDYNQYGDGYYGNNDPYYGNNDPYYGNGGYNGGSYNGGAYPYQSGYQSNTYSRHHNRCSRH